VKGSRWGCKCVMYARGEVWGGVVQYTGFSHLARSEARGLEMFFFWKRFVFSL
jgi:hypothetical protein